MRLLSGLTAVVFVLAGIAFGALNSTLVKIGFYWFEAELSLGVALLLAALVGAMLGGLALWSGVIWPLRRRLARQQRIQARAQAPGEHGADA
ncbi:MAG TPA: lipopolysaccharide assembly protein LapA domain-containing protein [Xanthomonadaceae bacterium]|nr:lipopolysaccharide assembly protein LapA domain-containing protein [Xanthomonadaceae bacterium]